VLFGRLAEGVDFLGEIDAHRTPGDTAPATDTSRHAELIDPSNPLSKAHNTCGHIHFGGLFSLETMEVFWIKRSIER